MENRSKITNPKLTAMLAAMVLTALPVMAMEANTVTAQAAPETIVLTYDEAYKRASEFNREYRSAKLDKEISEAQLQKAAAGFGPTVSLVGQAEPWGKPTTMNLGGMSMSSSIYNYYAKLSLSQPVFTFGKSLFGYKMAEEGYNIGQIKFKQASEKLELDVISAFYGALIAGQMDDTMQETLKANEEYLRITKTKYKNGQASNFDVLQAQVKYANAIPDAQKAADGAKLAMQMLKNTIGLPMDAPVELSGAPEYKKITMTYDEMKKRFSEKNDERNMINSAANIAEYSHLLAGAMLLPNIALSANYTCYSTDTAFHTESSYWTNSWDIAIGLQWTIYSGFKNVAAIKEASANREKARLTEENTENLLTIQLDQLYTSLEQSGKVIEAAGDIIKQAEEGYRIAEESYKNGLIQSVDLLQAQTGLLQAKINYLSALMNYTTTAQKLKNFIE
ncbi:MAG: TolC family protein [Spirochaetia bacterium]|nr:TolC family protein [Spirochaetia bacterium]